MSFTFYKWDNKCFLIPSPSFSYDSSFAIAIDFLWWGVELEITH
jgi:hypothetical protein